MMNIYETIKAKGLTKQESATQLRAIILSAIKSEDILLKRDVTATFEPTDFIDWENSDDTYIVKPWEVSISHGKWAHIIIEPTETDQLKVTAPDKEPMYTTLKGLDFILGMVL